MPDYLPFNLDWVRAVLVYSAIVFVISSAILIPSLRLLTPPRLNHLPNWLRWVLILPMAFFAGQIAEIVPRLLFAIFEIIINHHLTFKPGFNCLTWQVYSPIFFVIGGMLMAPSHRVAVFLTLDGLKIVVSIFNLHTILSFINRGGRWERLDPILNSPLWWNVSVYVLCIILLILIGIYFIVHKRRGNTMKSKLFNSDSLSREDSFLKAVISAMKFNLLWFIPLCLWVIIYFIIPNGSSGYHNIRLVFHRFTWGIFFSPSAYIFFSSILATILVPLQLLLLIITFFDRENPSYRRRYLWTVVSVLGIVVSMLVLNIIIWGSFPLPVDSEGYIRIRLIPFIPWPKQPLF